MSSTPRMFKVNVGRILAQDCPLFVTMEDDMLMCETRDDGVARNLSAPVRTKYKLINAVLIVLKK